MPTNKNALSRIKILDRLLSESVRRQYTMDDLKRLCNEHLKEDGKEEVGRRCIEKDLKFIETEFGEIKRERFGKKKIIRYASQIDGIFNQTISSSERKILQAISRTFGRMDGVEEFELFNQLKDSSSEQEQPIIIFEKNEELSNRDLLPKLLKLIESRSVVELQYHRIRDKQKRSKKKLYPYLLKQYRGRWFLFGITIDTKEVMCYSLDQIENIQTMADKFELRDIDWNDYFDDMIGVSKDKDTEPQEIIFWASNDECAYLEGKPIHHSQKKLGKSRSDELRRKFHIPDKIGKFFSIKCINNFELRRELASKFGERIVLEPEIIKNEIAKSIDEMTLRYKKLSKNEIEHK